MKKFLLIMVLCTPGQASFGQGFWATGACWIFDAVTIPYMERYTYIGDTTIDGMDVQVCLFEQCQTDLSSAWDCTSINSPFYEYTSLQLNVVLYQLYPFTSGWDTLYFLGVPGDRWWPRYADESCPPYGMVEIQDTGHVIIDGISLRSWDLAILDANGLPMPELNTPGTDTLSIIERVGGRPRRYCPASCDPKAPTDCNWLQMTHFSDIGIAIPPGTNCDISTGGHPTRSTGGSAFIHPTPGADHFQLNNTSTVSITVRDALGKVVHSATRLEPNTLVRTEDWPSGTYFITISEGTRAPQVLKWMKQ